MAAAIRDVMMECMLYSHEFWLPSGVKWCRLKRGDTLFLHLVPWIALLLILVRYIVESWLAQPLAVVCDISDRKCSPPQHNSTLLKAFRRSKHPGEELVTKLAKEVRWTNYQVLRWFWRARNYRKPSPMTKFKESCWRFVMYSLTSAYGIWALSKERFFWDLRLCYESYPSNTPSTTVLAYWMCQLAFYCSLLISMFTDVRRKDFYQTAIHHIVTISLLAVCYLLNQIQLGTMILLLHDVSDIPLELAKALHYAKFEKGAKISFAVFAVLFPVTRLIIYPLWLIWNVMFELPVYIGSFPALKPIIVLLVILLILHIYWFKMIALMVCKLLHGHEIDGDVRSDSEMSSGTEHSVKSVRK